MARYAPLQKKTAAPIAPSTSRGQFDPRPFPVRKAAEADLSDRQIAPSTLNSLPPTVDLASYLRNPAAPSQPQVKQPPLGNDAAAQRDRLPEQPPSQVNENASVLPALPWPQSAPPTQAAALAPKPTLQPDALSEEDAAEEPEADATQWLQAKPPIQAQGSMSTVPANFERQLAHADVEPVESLEDIRRSPRSAPLNIPLYSPEQMAAFGLQAQTEPAPTEDDEETPEEAPSLQAKRGLSPPPDDPPPEDTPLNIAQAPAGPRKIKIPANLLHPSQSVEMWRYIFKEFRYPDKFIEELLDYYKVHKRFPPCQPGEGGVGYDFEQHVDGSRTVTRIQGACSASPPYHTSGPTQQPAVRPQSPLIRPNFKDPDTKQRQIRAGECGKPADHISYRVEREYSTDQLYFSSLPEFPGNRRVTLPAGSSRWQMKDYPYVEVRRNNQPTTFKQGDVISLQVGDIVKVPLYDCSQANNPAAPPSAPPAPDPASRATENPAFNPPNSLLVPPAPSKNPAAQNSLELEGLRSHINVLPPHARKASDFDRDDPEKLRQAVKIGQKLQTLSTTERDIYDRILQEFNWDLEQLDRSIEGYLWTKRHFESGLEEPQDWEKILAAEPAQDKEKPNWQQIIKDLIASIFGAIKYAPEALGELWEEIKAHWPLFVGSLVALIVAEYVVASLVALPEPSLLTKVAAVALQGLILAVYGVSFAVSITSAIGEFKTWFDTAVNANGDKANIEIASRAFIAAIGHSLLAILSAKAFQRNISPKRLEALKAMLQRVKGRKLLQPAVPEPRNLAGDGKPALPLVPTSGKPGSYDFPLSPTSGRYLPPSQRPIVSIPKTPTSRPPGNPPSRLPGLPPARQAGSGIPPRPPAQPLQLPGGGQSSAGSGTSGSPPTQPLKPLQLPGGGQSPARSGTSDPPPTNPTAAPLTPLPQPAQSPAPGQSLPFAEPLPKLRTIPDLKPLGDQVRDTGILPNVTDAELQQVSKGTFLSKAQLMQFVGRIGNWQTLVEVDAGYLDLMQQIADLRREEVVRIYEKAIQILRDTNEKFRDLDIRLIDQGVALPIVVEILPTGSTNPTSDFDGTVYAGAEKEALETLVVEKFYELFRQEWRGESGLVFDTNLYTAGHLRPPAFKGDGEQFRWVNQLAETLKGISKAGGSPTATQIQKINRLVRRIDGLQEVTLETGSSVFTERDMRVLSRKVAVLQGALRKRIKAQYQRSREEYGAGPAFDALADIMALVHLKEFWHSEGADTEEADAPSSKWTELEQRLTHAGLSPATIKINQEHLAKANNIHKELVEARQNRIAELAKERPNDSPANRKMRANNDLYIEYSKKADAQLEEIREAEARGVAQGEIDDMKETHQQLRSKALFFANEAYLTASASEHIVLNLQLDIRLDLSVAQYVISMAAQVAFIGEQIGHHPNNLGRVLWKTAKYAQRMIDAIKQIDRQTENQLPAREIVGQAKALEPFVEQLLEIKNDLDLVTVAAKDAAAAQLPNALPIAADWGNRWFDLYVEVRLQVQQFFDQPPPARSAQPSPPTIE